MTFEWSHRKLSTLNKAISVFSDQLEEIHPDADLCYHSQYQTLTFSLYAISNTSAPTLCTVDCGSIRISSAFEHSPLIEQLAKDLDKFVTTN